LLLITKGAQITPWLVDCGHGFQKARAMSECSTVSTNSEEEIEFIVKRLEKSRFFLEFGSGASTLMALRNESLSIVSIDSSLEYLNFLADEIKTLELPLENAFFLFVDIGLTGLWGRPLDNSSVDKFPSYSRIPFEVLKSRDFTPDLILIDGRFRVATFLKAIVNCPDATIIFDDYYDRPQYFEVEIIIKPSDKCGRIAIFQTPHMLDSNQLKNIDEMIQRYVFNPD